MVFSKNSVSVGIGVLLLLTAGDASADTVYLKDGSRLQGSVTTMTDDQLLIDTDFAGSLDIDRDKLAGVTTDKPIRVALDNGRRSELRFDYDPDTGVENVVSTQTGEKPITLTRVAEIRPARIDEQAQAQKYTLPDYASHDELDHTEWSGNARLGVNGSHGNSNNLNIVASFAALRNTGLSRLNLLAAVNRASTDGDQTEADYLGRVTYERDFTRRWYGYIDQSLERDRFQNYALQSRTTIGPGYFLVRQRRLVFKLHTGAGYEYTQYYDNGGTDNSLIFTAGWHYGQLFGDYLKLTHDFDIYPRLTDSPTENFSLKSVLAATLPITDSSVWAISAQLENDYNNNPRDSDTDKLDTIYSLAIQRSF